jgi:hypothetical protein
MSASALNALTEVFRWELVVKLDGKWVDAQFAGGAVRVRCAH